MCCGLKQRNMHTFHRMLGYYMKDLGQPHLKSMSKNVSAGNLQTGVDLYVHYGTDEIKNRVWLSSANIFFSLVHDLEF